MIRLVSRFALISAARVPARSVAMSARVCTFYDRFPLTNDTVNVSYPKAGTQCEQTAHGTGCTSSATCGKDQGVAALQDELMWALRGLSVYENAAIEQGKGSPAVQAFVGDAAFATMTNVNNDPDRMFEYLKQTQAHLDDAKTRGSVSNVPDAARWTLPGDVDACIEAGKSQHSILHQREREGDTISGLKEFVTYAIKGMAAYHFHARNLGTVVEAADAFVPRACAKLAGSASVEELLGLILETGEKNLEVMAALDSAHVGVLGVPEPTEVHLGPIEGKGIIVSGHDMMDLKKLLEATSGRGVNVFTHGEMLPAHSYPELKKHPHLVGHIGGAWQNQQRDFRGGKASILMTTNCLIKPKGSYIDRLFTANTVGWPGVKHIKEFDYEPLIQSAMDAPGFESDPNPGKVTVGFGHDAILGMAGDILDLVAQKKLSHFFLIGGCDGSEGERNYFSELTKATPEDSFVLTLGCGKYRVINQGLGQHPAVPLPRVLDMGQCNDSYGAVKVALGLADALNCGVNELPLSMAVSWLEQKALAVAATLLHLGIENIRLGPVLPAFVTPDVLDVLVTKFKVKPIGTPEEDLKMMMKGM